MRKRRLGLYLMPLTLAAVCFALNWDNFPFVEKITGRQSASDQVTSRTSTTIIDPLKMYFFHEFEFAFITPSETDGSLFIESTLSGQLDAGYVIPTGNLVARGLQIPETGKYGTTVSKFDPKLAAGIYVNTIGDLYTLATLSANVAMKVEGLYYESDAECGNDRVIVKLIPENNTSSTLVSRSPSIILRKPHPEIKKIQLSAFKDISLLRENLHHIATQLTDRFKQYLENAGSKLNLTHFSTTPSMKAFKSDATQKIYISISWQGKEDEMFFMSGFFEGEERDGAIELNQVISFDDGERIGEYTPMKMVTLNERTFVIVDCTGWEGGYLSVYEILPDQPTWIFYMKSQGQYC